MTTIQETVKLSSLRSNKITDIPEAEGLTAAQVLQSRSADGWNEIPDKKPSVLYMLALKFYGLTPFMLEITIIVSAVLEKVAVAIIVAALLVLNALIALYQQLKAQKAIDNLKQKLSVQARVLRDGIVEKIPSRELVVNDIIYIQQGEFVSADAVVLKGRVEIDQSSLTGESKLIAKEITEEIFSGSIVHKGEATCKVIRIGKQTYFGKTISLVKTSSPKSHMDAVISKVTGLMMFIVLVMLIIAIVLQAIRDSSKLGTLVPLLLLLLTSAVPVALPTMFLVSSALATKELSKLGVIISRLQVTEDAAGMTILCSDKTGTLTKNEMTVTDIMPSKQNLPANVIKYAVLASRSEFQDHTDMAFIRYSELKELNLEKLYEPMQFIPFDYQNRRTEATLKHKSTGEIIVVTKGAVNTIRSLCKGLTKEDVATIDESVQTLAVKGHRSLAVAFKQGNGEFEFIGVVGISDPPRSDSSEVIKKLSLMGIRVIMLTGDAKSIATDVSKSVGLGPNVISLDTYKQKGENYLDNINFDEICGVAEIFPEDKHAIVKKLQSLGIGTIGMTGDGVNDSPSLKLAEVGIAVSNAADVAKNAASVVFNSEGLSAVLDLIRVGRQTHQRIETWMLNKIIKTFQMAIFVVLAFFATEQFIIAATHLVILLFLVDFVTVTLSTDERVIVQQPLKWNIQQLSIVSFIIAIACVAESFGMLAIALARYDGTASFQLTDQNKLNFIQTYMFEMLFFFGIFTIIIVRERRFWFYSHPSWQLITAISVDSIIMVILGTVNFPGVTPIPTLDVVIVIVYTMASSLIVNDTIKVLTFHLLGNDKISPSSTSLN